MQNRRCPASRGQSGRAEPHQRDLLRFCCHGIQLETWSPGFRGEKFGHPIPGPAGRQARQDRGADPDPLEHDIVVTSKSANPKRLSENANILDFSILTEDMESIDSLDEGYRVAWAPIDAGRLGGTPDRQGCRCFIYLLPRGRLDQPEGAAPGAPFSCIVFVTDSL